MINGVQILVHLPAFHLIFPANSLIIVTSIFTIATFDIPYLNVNAFSGGNFVTAEETSIMGGDESYQKGGENYHIKERAATMSMLEQLSYGNRYMSENLGSVYLMILITCVFLCMIVLLSICRFIPVCRKVVEKLKKKLVWNHCIRLIVEGCLELFFCSVLNM